MFSKAVRLGLSGVCIGMYTGYQYASIKDANMRRVEKMERNLELLNELREELENDVFYSHMVSLEGSREKLKVVSPDPALSKNLEDIDHALHSQPEVVGQTDDMADW